MLCCPPHRRARDIVRPRKTTRGSSEPCFAKPAATLLPHTPFQHTQGPTDPRLYNNTPTDPTKPRHPRPPQRVGGVSRASDSDRVVRGSLVVGAASARAAAWEMHRAVSVGGGSFALPLRKPKGLPP